MSADFNETRVPTTDWQAYRGVLSRRIFAFLIDYAIVALLWIPAAVVVFFLGILTLGLGFFLYPALFAIVAMLYFGLTMGGPSQASAGMNVMGLALARVDGRPVDFLTAIVHLVLFWIGNALLSRPLAARSPARHRHGPPRPLLRIGKAGRDKTLLACGS